MMLVSWVGWLAMAARRRSPFQAEEPRVWGGRWDRRCVLLLLIRFRIVQGMHPYQIEADEHGEEGGSGRNYQSQLMEGEGAGHGDLGDFEKRSISMGTKRWAARLSF
jgi:hypothetical protein